MPAELVPDTDPDPQPEPDATKTRPSRTRRTDAVQSAEQDAASPAEPELFGTTPHQRMDPKKLHMPDMQHGFQTIVRDLFESGFNVETEWKAVRAGLEITDALTPDRLRMAANAQERTAERAHQLYIIGKVEVQAYIRETDPTFGAMRDNARQSLERDKVSGARTKMITDADVLAEAARLYPDQWQEINTRRERAEAMLLQLQTVAQLARSRCYTVSNMANPSARFGA